jgi:hypothetical protein
MGGVEIIIDHCCRMSDLQGNQWWQTNSTMVMINVHDKLALWFVIWVRPVLFYNYSTYTSAYLIGNRCKAEVSLSLVNPRQTLRTWNAENILPCKYLCFFRSCSDLCLSNSNSRWVDRLMSSHNIKKHNIALIMLGETQTVLTCIWKRMKTKVQTESKLSKLQNAFVSGCMLPQYEGTWLWTTSPNYPKPFARIMKAGQ